MFSPFFTSRPRTTSLGLDGKPRELHVEETLDVADFDSVIPKEVVRGREVKKGENNLTYAIANEYFAVIKYELREALTEESDPEAFCIFTCVEDDTEITPASGPPVEVKLGRSVFIPAGMGQYIIRPKNSRSILIKSFVPDITKENTQ